MMAKDPEQRYSSMKGVACALNESQEAAEAQDIAGNQGEWAVAVHRFLHRSSIALPAADRRRGTIIVV